MWCTHSRTLVAQMKRTHEARVLERMPAPAQQIRRCTGQSPPVAARSAVQRMPDGSTRVTAAVVKKRFQVCRVYARIRLSLVHGVRIIGGVSDLIGLLTPHDAQCAFLRHALPLSLRQNVQWVMAITHQTSERAGVVPPQSPLRVRLRRQQGL